MAWNPAQRPRLSRVRAQHRALRELNAAYELPEAELSPSQIQEIGSALPVQNLSEFLGRLIVEAEFQYRFIRANGTLPKADVRLQLRMLQHHCWHILHHEAARSRHIDGLATCIRQLDRFVKALLLSSISQISESDLDPEYLLYRPEGLNAGLISQSAALAERQLVARGDYKNSALATSIAILVFAWTIAADGLPNTVRRKPEGFGAAGSGIASSDCAKFIFAFFEAVDPMVSKITITDALDQRLRSIRKSELMSLSTHKDDVVTLLHSFL